MLNAEPKIIIMGEDKENIESSNSPSIVPNRYMIQMP
jgi:hypothetical protein